MSLAGSSSDLNVEAAVSRRTSGSQSVVSSLVAYIQVLKPRETLLLAFVGVAALVIAADGRPPLPLLLLGAMAITLGTAGCNGLTNYLDRHLDAGMERTRARPLPSGRIAPAEKVLPWTGAIVGIGLVLCWMLHPLAFVIALIGVATSLVGRRRALTHLAGGIFGSAPVLVGYFAVDPQLTPTLLILALLVITWVPLHVWSVMVTYRQDYTNAGVRMFPLNWGEERTVHLILTCALSLVAVSLGAAFIVGFGLVYLTTAVALGGLIVYAAIRLVFGERRRGAWRLYRLSAFPYLGLLFVAMMLDLWV